MKLTSKIATTAVALAAFALPVTAGDYREVQIRSHPSQGKVAQIQNANARLATSPDGVFVNFETNGLEPGHAYTLLLAVMNAPGQCPVLPCTPKDVLKRSDVAQSDVAIAGSAIAGPTGEAVFAHYQEIGKFEPAFFEHGLKATEGVEIHLVLNDHGPLIEGREFEMLSTYRGGCSDDSIPGAMPATARAQGSPGPNQCKMVQFAQFIPAKPAS